MKSFHIRKSEWNNIKKFHNRIANYLKTEYECKKEEARMAVENAMAFDWAICTGNKCIIRIQPNIYRDKIYIKELQ